MHEPHDTVGPVERAYAQAEALLADGDARSSRRARVLDAVQRMAREDRWARAIPVPSVPPASRWVARWLVAASVAGLGVLVLSRLGLRHDGDVNVAHSPEASPKASPTASAVLPAPTVVAQANPDIGAAVDRVAPRVQGAPAAPPLRGALARAHKSSRDAPRSVDREPGARVDAAAIARSTTDEGRTNERWMNERRPNEGQTNDLAATQAPQAVGRPRADRPGVVGEPVGAAMGAAGAAPQRAKAADQNAPAPAARSASALTAPAGVPANPATDLSTRLRAAAQAGRSVELAQLLDQGTPVDAPDPQGDTALMKSVQGQWVESAALLAQRGASLDVRNKAGQSVRDLARAMNSPAMNAALGLAPR